jgi:hypothetical protein
MATLLMHEWLQLRKLEAAMNAMIYKEEEG